MGSEMCIRDRAYAKLKSDQLLIGRPDGVYSTLDLMTSKGRKSTVNMARKLKEQGADVLALACTGMATIGIAKELEEAAGIPVIDPVMAEGLFAYFEYLKK